MDDQSRYTVDAAGCCASAAAEMAARASYPSRGPLFRLEKKYLQKERRPSPGCKTTPRDGRKTSRLEYSYHSNRESKTTIRHQRYELEVATNMKSHLYNRRTASRGEDSVPYAR